MAKSTPRIEILKRGKRIKEFALGVPRLVIGSGADANVRLRAPNVKARHLAIEVVDRRYLQVVNLAADPNLLCDGSPFDEQRLSDGSEVTLGDVIFRLRLQAKKPATRDSKAVGIDTAESLPLPAARSSSRLSPPPPSPEDTPTPREQPAVVPVVARPPRPPPKKRAGVALGEDTELTLEDEASPAEESAAEQRSLGTQTVPMLEGEEAPWEQDVVLARAATIDPTPSAPTDQASPGSPRPIPYLMVHPPGVRRKRVRLPAGTFDLGAKGCAISLNFAGVADRHAVLTTHEDGTLTVEDAGSGLPTILNGRVIRRAQFRLGDTLQVGRVSFTLEPYVEPVKAAAPRRGEDAPDPSRAAAPTPQQSKFQAAASAKWVAAAMAKRESGEDEEDESMPGVPVAAAPAPAKPKTPPRTRQKPPPPARRAAPKTKAPPAKKRAPPPTPRKRAAAPPKKRAKPEVWAEMPTEYKWQKRKRAAVLFVLVALLLGTSVVYGGWRIYEDRKARAEAGPLRTETYSWGDQGQGGEGDYTWAGLVPAAPDDAEASGSKGSSRRGHSSRRSKDEGPESAIASADGSWSDQDTRADGANDEPEEDPEQRMLKDLMNESMDILDEEFESKKKAWVDMEGVEAVLRSVSSTARVCYKRALENDPELSGTLSLRITIDTDGKAGSISLDPMSTLANTDVQNCVERQIRSKSYPAARGGPVTFTYPFRFDR